MVARVTAMEMHPGPRPVYGGPGRTGVKTRPLTNPHGGSRGPADPWSASTASKRWDLWFFRSRKNNDISRRWQKDSRKANPVTNLKNKPRQSQQTKEKNNAPSAAEKKRGVRGAEGPPKRFPPGRSRGESLLIMFCPPSPRQGNSPEWWCRCRRWNAARSWRRAAPQCA